MIGRPLCWYTVVWHVIDIIKTASGQYFTRTWAPWIYEIEKRGLTTVVMAAAVP